MTCLVCRSSAASNLCTECAAELDNPIPFVAEQILSAAARPAGAALVDVWGGIHPLEPTTTIGRTPTARGISLFHASVSRRHAEITVDGERWTVRDLDSSNGTRVNDEDASQRDLASGDRISFGAVGFYFVLHDGHASDAPHLGSRTLRSEDAPRAEKPATPTDTTHAGLPHLGFKLVEAPAGGGGFLEAVGERLWLTDTQLAMLRMLSDRMLEQADQPSLLRGYVPSGQLIAELPWDSSAPDENHLKQLVRRIRRALDGIRLGGVIESRRGFGYRLRVIPIDLA
ncbi:MAG: FHA domain-containing protein [Kofleriaceae bacterium]